jgi:hypothetical protein
MYLSCHLCLISNISKGESEASRRTHLWGSAGTGLIKCWDGVWLRERSISGRVLTAFIFSTFLKHLGACMWPECDYMLAETVQLTGISSLLVGGCFRLSALTHNTTFPFPLFIPDTAAEDMVDMDFRGFWAKRSSIS